MYNEPAADDSLVARPHCDLIQRLPDLAPGASARRPRCDDELWRNRVDSRDPPLALALAAAILFLVAGSVAMIGVAAVGPAGGRGRTGR